MRIGTARSSYRHDESLFDSRTQYAWLAVLAVVRKRQTLQGKPPLGAQLQRRRGSVMISSESTGNTFICSFAGNQSGRFRRL